MSSVPKTAKLAFTDAVLNKLINLILGIENVQKACKITFSKDDMRTNHVVQKYLDAKMGDELRKYIYVKQCNKIRKECENTLDEDDILTITRAVLKMKNYKLTGSTDIKHVSYYFITPK